MRFCVCVCVCVPYDFFFVVCVPGSWLDKAFLCTLGAKQAGARCVWQKIVLDGPPCLERSGRPSQFILPGRKTLNRNLFVICQYAPRVY